MNYLGPSNAIAVLFDFLAARRALIAVDGMNAKLGALVGDDKLSPPGR
jgi:hypothetical protein